MLASRQGLTPEAFLEEFLRTLQPGVIPRSEFIAWSAIDQTVASARKSLEYFESSLAAAGKKNLLKQEIADALLADDNPEMLLRTAFALLGHTGELFVSSVDDLSIRQAADRIAAGDRKQAELVASILTDIGIHRVISRENVVDTFFGVQVGLECNRRKNVGGEAFKKAVSIELRRTVNELSKRVGGLQLKEELKIPYSGISKTVDFAITKDSTPIVGFEANFYTTTGSKPTEIKRSYQAVTEGLKSVGVELVWVTDGKGYLHMQRSLKDAFRVLPNIYNLAMLHKHLTSDLTALLSQ